MSFRLLSLRPNYKSSEFEPNNYFGLILLFWPDIIRIYLIFLPGAKLRSPRIVSALVSGVYKLLQTQRFLALHRLPPLSRVFANTRRTSALQVYQRTPAHLRSAIMAAQMSKKKKVRFSNPHSNLRFDSSMYCVFVYDGFDFAVVRCGWSVLCGA